VPGHWHCTLPAKPAGRPCLDRSSTR
jgi:hypothetical protein